MVQRVPLIVVDPSSAADATRGRVEQRFVESVDIVPTILESLGVARPAHRLEGSSLLPLLHRQQDGAVPAWRDTVYSELDYSFKEARRRVGKTPQNARAYSLRNARWRYVYWLDEPEQLYDLQADPDEMHDLGRDAGTASLRAELRTQMLDWLARRKRRTTISDEAVERGTNAHKRAGVYFGQW
jgi:arylsulfatase A-like enzyme